MTNVVQFTGQTTCDVPSEKVLADALTKNLTDVIVIGRSESGALYFASSQADGAQVLWSLEQAKIGLFLAAEVIPK